MTNDMCSICGNHFDFPENDLVVTELEGNEVLVCLACNGADDVVSAVD